MYSEYQPGLWLSLYIDKYWEFKGRPTCGEHLNILPDGCTDFIFTLGEVDQTGDETPVMQPCRSYFVGPMTKYSELTPHTPAGGPFSSLWNFPVYGSSLTRTHQSESQHDRLDFFI